MMLSPLEAVTQEMNLLYGKCKGGRGEKLSRGRSGGLKTVHPEVELGTSLPNIHDSINNNNRYQPKEEF